MKSILTVQWVSYGIKYQLGNYMVTNNYRKSLKLHANAFNNDVVLFKATY